MPPEVHEAAVLQHAQNLGLRVHAHGRDLVEKERAAVGNFKQALLGRDRRSKRAFHVAEQRGLEQFRRHGAGVDGHEGFVAARRIRMDGLGNDLLARAALALNQNRRAAGRDLRHEVEDAQHAFALAHDVLEAVALLEGALELKIFFFGAVAGDGRANVGKQFLVIPGLLDKVFRACANSLDDVVNGAVGGDHDDRQLGLAFLELRQQLDAALAGQRQIEKHEIEAFAIEELQSLLAVAGGLHNIVLETEKHLQRLTDAGLVVDHEDRSRVGITVDGRCGIGCAQGQFFLGIVVKHEQNSSTGETQDERWCRRRPSFPREFFRRAPG